MLTKRGAAHFEMVVAFVLFTGFVFFILTIIKPYDEQKLSYAVLEGLFDSFSDEAETSYTLFFLKVNATSDGCFYLDLDDKLFSSNFSNPKVFNLSGEIINSSISDSKLSVDGDEDYYYVSYSPDFESGIFDCSNVALNYTIGNIEEKSVLSLKKVEEMQINYSIDYLSLKEKLGVPGVYDFSIKSDSLGINMEKNVPQTGDVLAREYIVEVLDYSTGQIVNANIILKVW